MSRAISIAAGAVVLIVWWSVVLTQIISRSGVAELLGISIALNTGLLIEVIVANRYRRSK